MAGRLHQSNDIGPPVKSAVSSCKRQRHWQSSRQTTSHLRRRYDYNNYNSSNSTYDMNLFGKAKQPGPTAKDSIVELREKLEMLEKRERVGRRCCAWVAL